MISVRRFEAVEWRAYRDLRLRALTESPDAFGSKLEYEQGRTDAEWADRLARSADSEESLALLAASDGRPVGLAWGRRSADSVTTVHVYQMWVDPAARGSGAGRMLLDAIVDWARGAGADRVALDVTRGNDAAERLYARAGFTPTGDPQPLRPGSDLRSQRMELRL